MEYPFPSSVPNKQSLTNLFRAVRSRVKINEAEKENYLPSIEISNMSGTHSTIKFLGHSSWRSEQGKISGENLRLRLDACNFNAVSFPSYPIKA